MTTFAEGKVTNDLLDESNGSFLGVSPASDTFDNFHFFLRLPLPLTPLTQLSPASPRFVPYQPYTYLESSCPLSVTVSQDAIWGTTSSSHLQRKLTVYFPSFSSPCSVVARVSFEDSSFSSSELMCLHGCDTPSTPGQEHIPSPSEQISL